MKHHVLRSAVGLIALAGTAEADDLFKENVVIQGNLCTGPACLETETFSGATPIKIKGASIGLKLEDTGGSSTNDWDILANAAFEDSFNIRDATASTVPFKILGGAQTNALVIDENGRIGLNTQMPEESLHISAIAPALRLEDTLGSPGVWDVQANGSRFFIRDEVAETAPLILDAAAPTFSFVVRESGFVGLGTNDPDAPLEVFGEDTFNFFRITADGAATNQSVDFVFTEGPLGTGELRYNIVDSDGPEMRLNADGDMVLDGTLTTGGPTCAGGCDAVFDAGFERLSVSDHAALMWEKGHLPAVGPTLPNAPMNVSEKMGAMLNELEHAHIYIEQLHDEARARDAIIADLLARLEAVEAR